MKTLEALRKLERILKKRNPEAALFITGGFVRDFLRRKANKDLDVVLYHTSLRTARKHLNKFGKTKQITIHNVPGADSVTTLLFKANGDEMDAQISRIKVPKQVKSRGLKAHLKFDSKHRDFSINAMYMPINDITSKNVIDLHGGRNDIAGKQILSVGAAKARFHESPIRILRAFSLASRLKYTISQHVKEAIRTNAYLLEKVPPEAIRAELEEILLSHKPSLYLKLMQKLGVLKVILPELDACYNCTQDKRYHKYDVFRHLIYTCDNSEPDLVLRLAGLFHDIGKPIARAESGDKVTFYRHEVIGEKATGVILKRLRFDNDTIDKVTHLVRMHMYHYTREYTDAGVRRFINNAGIKQEDIEEIGEFPLFKLRKAERLGNGYKKNPVTPRQLDFETRLVQVYKQSSGLKITDLVVDGNDIKSVFNMKAGKEIGVILRYLLDKVMEEPALNNRQDLLHHALDFLENRREDNGKH